MSVAAAPRGARTLRARAIAAAAAAGLLVAVVGIGRSGAAPAVAAPASPGPAATTVTSPAAATKAPKVVKVVLKGVENATGAERSYEARVLDENGTALAGADLDIAGLTDDPDLRIRTVTMEPTDADPTVYRAVVTVPADADWVLVVRVGKPSEYVELFYETMTGVAARPDGHDLAANPARRAVAAISPDFYARYDPTRTNPGSPLTEAEKTAAAVAHGSNGAGGVDAEHHEGLDVTTVVFVILHVLGAVAWLVTVGGLVLANRVGSGSARGDLVAFVARHYTLLAGGGLLVVVLSGLSNVQNASPGLTSPGELAESGLGVVYLGVFALKMVLVAGSIVTTVRVGRLLPRSTAVPTRPALSLSAAADDGPSRRLLSLAEANARLAVLIILCVGVLSQIHHVLH